MFTRSTPGFRFKNNRLHLFSHDSVVLIDSWPELRCLRKTADLPHWQPYQPEFRIIKPYRRTAARKKPQAGMRQTEMDFDVPVHRPVIPSLSVQKKKAFDQFRFSIPQPVAARVERFSNRQWALLQLFEKEPRALDVCRSNPALTFALVHAGSFRDVRGGDSLQFATNCILEKQRVLLDRIHFPGTNSTVKVMSKLVPESVCLPNLRHIRSSLTDRQAVKILSHLPRINTGILELLSLDLFGAKLPMSLLEEVSQVPVEKYRACVASSIRESLFMLEQLEKKASAGDFRNMELVSRLNNELTEEYSKFESARRLNRRFPLPPLPGTQSIVPIRSEWELIREGKEQSNCVASYADRVINRATFIYKVIAPNDVPYPFFEVRTVPGRSTN